jgi:hypothetical protein
MIPDIDTLARRYVALTLAVGQHDRYLVDAYFGPAELQPKQQLSLAQLEPQLQELQEQLNLQVGASQDPTHTQRCSALLASLRALMARLRLLQGEQLSLAEECQQIYDIGLPTPAPEIWDAARSSLNDLLPGSAALWQRLEALERALYVPEAQLLPLFEHCVATVRARTRTQLQLPDAESFSIELVRGEPWSAYNWFKGGARSHIQLNVDIPVILPRLLHLAAHEGYPGHHAHHSLMEQEFFVRRAWVEYSIYPLFGPQSVIAEGIADTALDVLFSPEERMDFELQQLSGQAGISKEPLVLYHSVARQLGVLRHVELGIAADYLGGTLSADQAVQRLTHLALVRPDRAHKRLQFIERYRGYVCTYSCGKDLVSAYVFKTAVSPTEQPLIPIVRSWKRLESLMRRSVLPSAL